MSDPVNTLKAMVQHIEDIGDCPSIQTRAVLDIASRLATLEATRGLCPHCEKPLVCSNRICTGKALPDLEEDYECDLQSLVDHYYYRIVNTFPTASILKDYRIALKTLLMELAKDARIKDYIE